MINVDQVKPGMARSPPTPGQLLARESGGHDLAGSHGGAAEGGDAATSTLTRPGPALRPMSRWPWPLPHPFLYEGDEALTHPVAFVGDGIHDHH
jgi:hypothetical protein